MRYLLLHYDVGFPHETEVNIIQIFPLYCAPIIVILVYNPPHVNKRQFIDSLESLLHLVIRDKLDYVILGNLNIDVMTDSHAKNRLCNLTDSLGATQLIVDPTRVTFTSQTLLDHIYISFPTKVVQSSVFCVTTSDHRFTYFVKRSKHTKGPSKIIQYRSLKNFDALEIGDNLEKMDWSSLSNNLDVNFQLEFLEKTLLDFVEDSCLLKRK